MSRSNLFRDIYCNPYNLHGRYKLFGSSKDSESFIQRFKISAKLAVHEGCVNTLCWNDTGEYILSGSDDQHLCITHGSTYKKLTSIQTGHKANIFSAKFLPDTNDRQIVSCSGDGVIIFTELDRPELNVNNCFNCHFGTAYKIVTVPNDAKTFLSCGEDGTVRWFDLRIKSRCSIETCKEDILIDCRRAVTALAVNPVAPYHLAVGCADSTVRIYDRRMLGTQATGFSYSAKNKQGYLSKFSVPEFDGRSHRITSLVYSKDASEVLVNYSSDYLYLFRVKGGEYDGGTALIPPTSSKAGGKKKGSAPPPMKRLRLRGDWSDTGPNARPESEMRHENPSIESGRRSVLHVNLIQHVSDVLIRMLNDSTRQQRRPATARRRASAPGDESSASPGTSSAVPGESVITSAVSVESDTTQSVNDVVSSSPISRESVQDMDSSTGDDHLGMSAESSPLPPHEFSSDSETTADASRCPSVPSRPKSPVPDPSPEREMAIEDLETTCISGNREPTVSLHYNPQGVNSGLIRVNPSPCTSPNLIRTPSPGFSGIIKGGGSQAGETMDCEQSKYSTATDEEKPGPSSDNLVQSSNQDVPKLQSPSEDSVDSVPPNPQRLPSIDNSRMEEIGDADIEVDDEEEYGDYNDNDNDGGNEQSESVHQNNDQQRLERSSAFSEDDEELDREIDAMEQPRRTRYITSRRRDSSRDILNTMDDACQNQDFDSEQEQSSYRSFVQPTMLRKFVGHRNARTMIKESNFWGDNYVMSGSDCGHIFVWNRHTADLVMVMEADKHVVNCIQPHPFDPVLASSGIDYDIKLWAPINEKPAFDYKFASEIMRRNEVMLEETRDTITVPASFMIRMLASLNNLRQGGGLSRLRQSRSNPSGEAI